MRLKMGAVTDDVDGPAGAAGESPAAGGRRGGEGARRGLAVRREKSSSEVLPQKKRGMGSACEDLGALP